MSPAWNVNARRLGVVCAVATVVFSLIYAIILIVGLLSLPSPEAPIGDPYFPIMEFLILLLAPVMVAVMVAVHAWAPPEAKVFVLLAVLFMVLMAGTTSGVHLVILTLGRHPAFTGQSWVPLVLEFRWPSVAYVLDILAWDVFFSLAVFCAAVAFGGTRLATSIRVLLILSGALALGGLNGVITGDMQLRNIGILGYAVVFPVATGLLALLFLRRAPVQYPTQASHADASPTAVSDAG